MSRQNKAASDANASAGASLPLAGVRVLDFSHAAAGPFTSMLLGDMGAEIIKIERPGSGDGSRSMGVPMPGFPPRNSDYYLSLNRNKKGVALNLSDPEGVKLALALARTSDIIVQNFRPGVMDRLGLGYDALRAQRSGLIYCSISAFGASGPWSERPANDIIMQSVSGLMGITGEVGGGPVRIGAPISDFSTGLFALSGILAALHARDRHPDGQHVEVAMLDASFNMMCNYIPSVTGLGAKIPRLGRGHAQIVPYQAFLCADNEYVMVGAFTRAFWQNLCHALGRADWLTDERFATNAARLRNRDILVGDLDAIFRTKPRSEWLTILENADVPSSPVLELHDAVTTDQAKANKSIVTLEGGGRSVQVARSAICTEEWGEPSHRIAPDIGQDTDSVLQSIVGLSEAEIESLKARGIVAIPKNAN